MRFDRNATLLDVRPRDSDDKFLGGLVSKEEPEKPPNRNKLHYKNRWLISRHLVTHLRRAGVVCNIIVPENIGLSSDGAMSPGERVALALVAKGIEVDHPALEGEEELIVALRRIKTRH
jgi:hypothetical protein